jgi:O-antigen/teichoic acid export membrane protein
LKFLRQPALWLILLLLLLPLLWFAPQALGGKTLLPADNLFSFEPWKSFAAQEGVGTPHNLLISDLILENYGWKSLIVEALRAGRPADILWSPRLFSGAPFLAAGQHSALYPLSILFYVLPLWKAFGVFTWLQLGLAGVGMHLFARALRLHPMAALFAAVAYTFSGFMIVSVNFTMFVAAVAWLPYILTAVETMARKQEEKGNAPFSPAVYVAAGAIALGLLALAGHVEILYYTLMVTVYWSAWRLIGVWRQVGSIRPPLRLAGWIAAMVVLGLALGAVQLIPFYELGRQSFREGSATLQQIRDWAWPTRQVVTFVLPDFFGNPTHHQYFDIWARAWAPVTQNALGEPLDTIDWGVKNYVEGGNYLGLLTLLLAAVAVLGTLAGVLRGFVISRSGRGVTGERRAHHVMGLAILAVLSLAFAFGTPLYAVLYYLLPGYSQLHSAFRWVFPYTLCMAALAGIGLDWLMAERQRQRIQVDKRIHDRSSSVYPLSSAAVAGWLALIGGLMALAVVLVSMVAPGPFVAIGDRILAASDLARMRGFANGAMAWSYEAIGLARFGLMAVFAGGVLIWATRGSKGAGERRSNWWAAAAVGALVLDLWLFGRGFNTAADPKLLDFTPPVVAWLQERHDPVQPWRLTSFDKPGEKLLNANAVMPFGLEDARGYDSIIAKQYVGYMERIQPQWDLLYNRIAPIYTQLGDQPNYDALDNPLLDLLGVKYVVTTSTIPNPGYTQVYTGEVKVYENAGALPRVFIAGEAVAAADQAAALDLAGTVNPAQTVVVEGIAPADLPPPASPQLREARIGRPGQRELFVDVNISDRGWLVLTDAYFDGWKAYLRPFGVEGEGVSASGESIEEQLQIHRAYGNFRAVYLPEAGQWTVRFVYSPRSLLLGLYGGFLAGTTLFLLLGWWAWGRLYRGDREGSGSEVRTVAKNTSVQMGMSLMSKGIDFAFAMLRLRVLSPSGEGSYAFAIGFYGIFEIITRFGLGTLAARDISLDKSKARSYLRNMVALRVGLWLLSLPLMFLFAAFYRVALDQLTRQEAEAILLFALALLFANVADAISAVFIAYEKMEYPASTSTAIALAKVALGALVILPPFNWGFVGLAGVSLVMNVVQMFWLYVLLRQKVLPPAETPARLDPGLQRYMLRESAPLMINHLLATVFWRISQFVLRGATNPAALGIYSAGVKYLDGLNVIPSYFTLALFPLMSRYAARGITNGTGGDSLSRTYRLAMQLLFMIALPIAVAFTFAATPLIRILGGAAYLPDSAIALRIMIWSIPIGFVNSVTQYVLIAVNQQRFLTRAFLIGVVFTTIANLLLIPRYGYLAAAALLIPAELALFLPFAWAVGRYVAPMPWLRMFARPLLATALNLGVVYLLLEAGAPLLLALPAGFAVYAGALWLLGAYRGDEFQSLREALRRAR